MFPEDFLLVAGLPDEPKHSDIDAICSLPTPFSFFQELYRTLSGFVLTSWEILEEERTDEVLKIRAWSGTTTLGLERLEERCLETSLIPLNIECITHGLPAMEVRWQFAFEHAGQLGHAAFRHVRLIAQFEHEQALKDFEKIWSKVFNRETVFERRNLKQLRL